MTKQANAAIGDAGMKPLAYRLGDAAKALGISIESFERHVEARIKIVPLGKMKLVAVAELERFLDEEAYRIGGDW
jgi:hypothetical protein